MTTNTKIAQRLPWQHFQQKNQNGFTGNFPAKNMKVKPRAKKKRIENKTSILSLTHIETRKQIFGILFFQIKVRAKTIPLRNSFIFQLFARDSVDMLTIQRSSMARDNLLRDKVDPLFNVFLVQKPEETKMNFNGATTNFAAVRSVAMPRYIFNQSQSFN